MKNQLLKTMLLLFALIAGSVSTWAATVTWERVTSISTLTSGGTFIMGYEATANSGEIVPLRSKDCNATTTANGYFNTGITDGSSTNGTINFADLSGVSTGDYEIYISASATDGYINIQRQNDTGAYYGATSGGTTSNKARLYTSGNTNETNLKPEWASETDNQFKISANVSGNYKYLKYNTGSPRFAFYNSVGEKIVFYKKVVSFSATLDHIVLGGTYPTEFYVGDTFTHDGLTVTAHYDDTSTLDVTASATFSSPDMSTSGTKTITVSYEENSVTKTATYDITVSPAPPVVLTMDFSTNILNLPTSATTTETGYTYGGYTYTLAAPDAYFWQTSGAHYVLMGKTGATFKFPAYPFVVKRIKVYGRSEASGSSKFNIFVGDEAICTEVTSSKVDHMFNIPSAKQTAGTVYTIKSTANANMQITKIELYSDDAAPAFIATSGWSTFVCYADLDFAKATPAGLEAYVVPSVTASTVTLKSIPHAQAGTGVILKGTAGTTYSIPVIPSTDPIGTNKLQAAVTATPVDANKVYVLKGGKFCKVTGASTVPAGKAYLLAADVPTSASELTFDFNGETTGVSTLNVERETLNGEVYNLNGQRVAQPTKGLYIVNGKKYIVK